LRESSTGKQGNDQGGEQSFHFLSFVILTVDMHRLVFGDKKF
jgi:hypothetical protein